MNITSMIRGGLIAVLPLFAAACAWSSDPDYIGGHPVDTYIAQVKQERQTGEPIRIAYKCFNDCVIKLGGANVEIAPNAILSAHAIWGGVPAEDLMTPAVYAEMVPPCARRVLDRTPYMTDPLWRVRGRDILAACPQMHELRE